MIPDGAVLGAPKRFPSPIRDPLMFAFPCEKMTGCDPDVT